LKTSGPISYRRLKEGGYQLLDDWWVDTDIHGCAARIDGFVELDDRGRLTIHKLYRWDGASGPAIDRKGNMRAGLAHDGLYQLHRAGKLDPEVRAYSDQVFRDLVAQDSRRWLRWVGWLDYVGLRLFASHAAKPQPEVEVKALRAP